MQSSGQTDPVSRLKEALDNLTERERMLLKVMFGVFAVLALSVVVFLAQQSTADLEEETIRYETALELLATEGPAFAEQQAESSEDEALTHADRFTEEVLRDNQVQLTSDIAAHAAAVDVNVSSYDTDEQPLGEDNFGEEEGPMIIERQLQIDIRGAEMDRLIEMLHRIEESRDPIVIKRLDIRSVREEGQVRALVAVSTFEYGDEGES